MPPHIYSNMLTNQVDTAPAARLWNLLEVIVRQLHDSDSVEVVEGVWKSSETVVSNIKLLQLGTLPTNIIRQTYTNTQQRALTFYRLVLFPRELYLTNFERESFSANSKV